MVKQRLKTLAAAGILCAALGGAAVNGAFAAPQTAASTPTATVTQTASSGQTGTAPNAAQPGHRGPGGRGPRFGFGPGPAGDQALATFLGITTTDLRTARQGGQTLAQIAQAHGKTTDQLKTFLTNQTKTQLDKAVQSGRMTSARETQILSNLSSRLDTMINQKFQPRGPGRPGGPMGPGFFDQNGVAQFLGITVQDLRTALQNGQTLAQVAQAHGKTAADLKTYLMNQESQRIDTLINTKFQFHPWPGRPAATPTSTSSGTTAAQ